MQDIFDTLECSGHGFEAVGKNLLEVPADQYLSVSSVGTGSRAVLGRLRYTFDTSSGLVRFSD